MDITLNEIETALTEIVKVVEDVRAGFAAAVKANMVDSGYDSTWTEFTEACDIRSWLSGRGGSYSQGEQLFQVLKLAKEIAKSNRG